MSTEVSAKSVARLLAGATRDTRVVLPPPAQPRVIRMDQVNVERLPHFQVSRLRERCLTDSSVWQCYGPGFDLLSDWVSSHWAAPVEVRPPQGTVAIDPYLHGLSNRREQLNVLDATRKLVVAAAIHGADRVGRYAAAFTAHGLIENRQIWLVKGIGISRRRKLDNYCTLLPYDTMRTRLQEDKDAFGARDWPWPQAESVCALEVKRFEDSDGTVYASPLIGHGAEQLALLISLVWGYGLRTFWGWKYVPSVVGDTLPLGVADFGVGSGRFLKEELAVDGFSSSGRKRPLEVSELGRLAHAYSDLGETTQRRLQIAMRRLRDSMLRVRAEDVVIDQAIALEALFVEPEEWQDKKKIVSSRASWYYADSRRERRETRELLQEFYDRRSRIVHGGEVPELESTPSESKLLDVRRVLQASINSMVVDDRPSSWDGAQGDLSIRRDPPRPKADIPSDKADSLSWSVQDQDEIDRQLERVWKATIANAEPHATTRSRSVYHGWKRQDVEQCQARDIPYVIVHPARLYGAHPKWPTRPSDALDDRTTYYCEKDVERHLQAWRDAALAKGINCFMLPNDAEYYHPGNRDRWPQPVE